MLRSLKRDLPKTDNEPKPESLFATGSALKAESDTATPDSVYKFIRSVLLVVLTAVLATVLIPGIVAYSGGVFYKSGLIQHLPPDTKLHYQSYEEGKDRLRNLSESIDGALRDPSIRDKPREIRELIETKEKIETRLTTMERKPPVVLIPFYPQPSQFLFTGPYIALGLLLIFRSSISLTPRRFLATMWLAILIYILYQTPLWIRNFVSTNEGRVIFAFPNADIHFGSFIIQELIIFGFSCLLAVCWYSWAEAGQHARRKAVELRSKGSVFDIALGEEVSDAYLQWTWYSLVLGLGFFFFTSFYWKLVHGYNDDRYLASAIIAHVLWGVSWALLSMPLFWIWRAWHHLRLRIISELATTREETGKAQSESKLKLLTESEPIGSVRAGIGWLGATVSFVAPIVQALFK